MLRRLLQLLAFAGSFLILAPLVATAQSRAQEVEKEIRQLISASGAEMVAVAFHDLQTGDEMLINADERFHAASTMKLPVMMEIFREAERGQLSLDERITISNQFTSLADGSRYALSAEDDSEKSLYKRVGETETVGRLLRLMITVSSNLATNNLIERVTPQRVMELMRELGASHVQVLRGVEDNKAYERGINNTTTARDLMILFQSLAEGRAVSPKSSIEMVKVLLEQEFKAGIPAGLPSGVKVAHKTGSFTGTDHDAGIVYVPGRQPYVLVVLTRGIKEQKRADKLIADISRTIFVEIIGGIVKKSGIPERGPLLMPAFPFYRIPARLANLPSSIPSVQASRVVSGRQRQRR